MDSVRNHLIAAISTIAVWIAVGTVAFRELEGWSWVNSFYFSVATLSTVGYGDLFPTTTLSKLFTSLYILIGVAVVLTALGILGTKYLEVSGGKIFDGKGHKSKYHYHRKHGKRTPRA